MRKILGLVLFICLVPACALLALASATVTPQTAPSLSAPSATGVPTTEAAATQPATVTPTVAQKPTASPVSSPTLSASATATTVSAGFKVVGYYPSWAVYPDQLNYPPDKVPADQLTHLIYAFELPSAKGECTQGDAQADGMNFPLLKKLKQEHPQLKILFSIGGEGSNNAPNFSTAAKNEASRQHFVQSCVSFMLANGFEGIDVDWEAPTSAEKSIYMSLLQEFRKQLDAAGQPSGAHYLLTIAAPSGPYGTDFLDIAGLGNLLDWVNLMTYDFHGSWSATTGHNAPLYTSPQDTQQNSDDTSVKFYLDAGLPANKLMLGVPFYGRALQGVKDVDHGLYQTFSGPWKDEFFLYRDIIKLLNNPFTRYWDDTAKVPWLYDPGTKVFITYDDPQSLKVKAQYARDHSLGGVMIWELSGDDDQNSLLQAVVEGLR